MTKLTGETSEVLIGIGSNLNDPKKQILKAINSISAATQIKLIARSSVYRSKPQGPQDQDDFYNAVILIETDFDPATLLTEMQKIEHDQGRQKTRHWGERVIDLDILFYGNQCINLLNPALTIPHPHALTRDFVVIPALEAAPYWALPDGSPLSEYTQQCINHRLTKVH